MQRCNILNSPTSWDDMISVGCSDWKEKTCLGTICRLILSSTVYSIGRERNEIKFGDQPKTEEQILKIIFWEIRYRVFGKRKFQEEYGEHLALPKLEY
jgi:hypothetical protein